MSRLTTGQLAKKAGVITETIRYYERRALIPVPPRSDSGYRYFPDETVARVRFIKGAQQVGFTLKEIKVLLALRMDPQRSTTVIQKRTATKITEIEEKIKVLRQMKKALVRFLEACKSQDPTRPCCPILEALEFSWNSQKTKGGP